MRSLFWTMIVAMAVGCDTTPIGMQPTAPPAGSNVVAPPVVSGATGETPQAVMQRYEDAKNRRDFRTQANCLTPETLQAFAAMRIGEALGQIGFEDRELRVFERYGVSLDRLQQLADMPPGDAKKQAVRATAASMNDLAGFYAGEMTKGARTLTAKPPPAEITSVDVQGDTATAHVVANIEGQAFHADVRLRLVGGSWKVDDSHYYEF